MQLLPRFIILIVLFPMQDSKIFKLIFKFSIINSVRYVLFANIPPTFAAALIIMSGLTASIVLLVSARENKSVSFLLDWTTSVIISEF